mmetsp:Transcript_21868/g.38684  ORF Transcript_21868/g.38684 Transcript_21868/m.38684 type:complete len:1353 (+) Transcript_21868:279-4337(+)
MVADMVTRSHDGTAPDHGAHTEPSVTRKSRALHWEGRPVNKLLVAEIETALRYLNVDLNGKHLKKDLKKLLVDTLENISQEAADNTPSFTIIPSEELGDESSEAAATKVDYGQLLAQVDTFKVSELREHLKNLDVSIGGKRLKKDLKELLVNTLTSRLHSAGQNAAENTLSEPMPSSNVILSATSTKGGAQHDPHAQASSQKLQLAQRGDGVWTWDDKPLEDYRVVDLRALLTRFNLAKFGVKATAIKRIIKNAKKIQDILLEELKAEEQEEADAEFSTNVEPDGSDVGESVQVAQDRRKRSFSAEVESSSESDSTSQEEDSSNREDTDHDENAAEQDNSSPRIQVGPQSRTRKTGPRIRTRKGGFQSSSPPLKYALKDNLTEDEAGGLSEAIKSDSSVESSPEENSPHHSVLSPKWDKARVPRSARRTGPRMPKRKREQNNGEDEDLLSENESEDKNTNKEATEASIEKREGKEGEESEEDYMDENGDNSDALNTKSKITQVKERLAETKQNKIKSVLHSLGLDVLGSKVVRLERLAEHFVTKNAELTLSALRHYANLVGVSAKGNKSALSSRLHETFHAIGNVEEESVHSCSDDDDEVASLVTHGVREVTEGAESSDEIDIPATDVEVSQSDSDSNSVLQRDVDMSTDSDDGIEKQSDSSKRQKRNKISRMPPGEGSDESMDDVEEAVRKPQYVSTTLLSSHRKPKKKHSRLGRNGEASHRIPKDMGSTGQSKSVEKQDEVISTSHEAVSENVDAFYEENDLQSGLVKDASKRSKRGLKAGTAFDTKRVSKRRNGPTSLESDNESGRQGPRVEDQEEFGSPGLLSRRGDAIQDGAKVAREGSKEELEGKTDMERTPDNTFVKQISNERTDDIPSMNQASSILSHDERDDDSASVVSTPAPVSSKKAYAYEKHSDSQEAGDIAKELDLSFSYQSTSQPNAVQAGESTDVEMSFASQKSVAAVETDKLERIVEKCSEKGISKEEFERLDDVLRRLAEVDSDEDMEFKAQHSTAKKKKRARNSDLNPVISSHRKYDDDQDSELQNSSARKQARTMYHNKTRTIPETPDIGRSHRYSSNGRSPNLRASLLNEDLDVTQPEARSPFVSRSYEPSARSPAQFNVGQTPKYASQPSPFEHRRRESRQSQSVFRQGVPRSRYASPLPTSQSRRDRFGSSRPVFGSARKALRPTPSKTGFSPAAPLATSSARKAGNYFNKIMAEESSKYDQEYKSQPDISSNRFISQKFISVKPGGSGSVVGKLFSSPLSQANDEAKTLEPHPRYTKGLSTDALKTQSQSKPDTNPSTPGQGRTSQLPSATTSKVHTASKYLFSPAPKVSQNVSISKEDLELRQKEFEF